jgi:hypothetical protein
MAKDKISVQGEATLKVPFTVELNTTIEQFDALTVQEQNQTIDDMIDWVHATRSAKVDDIEVDNVEVVDRAEGSV